jgi:hypothetical protein
MVRHRGVGQDVDGESAGRLADQLGDPGASVFGLIAAEVGAADAAGDDVEGTGALVIDQDMAWEGHEIVMDPHEPKRGRVGVGSRACPCFVQALTHRLRAATGQAPATWMRRRRCLLAQRLLSAGLGVGEAAAALGFAEASHFSRQFHALTGQWPSDWRATAGYVAG